MDDNFTLYSGNDDNFTDFTALSGKGLISVVSNVIPKELQEVYELQSSGHSTTARERFSDLMPVINAVKSMYCDSCQSDYCFTWLWNYELRLPYSL